jgi:hypothetical protein
MRLSRQEQIDLVDNDGNKDITVVERGEWTYCPPGYETQTLIFRKNGRHFRFTHVRQATRTSMPISNVHDGYHSGLAKEVEQVTTVTWEEVTD